MSIPPSALNSEPGSHIVVSWPLAAVIIAVLTSITVLAIAHVIPSEVITHALAMVIGVVIPFPIVRKLEEP